MAGTVEGGKKAALTNKKIYGENWYEIIGAKGGKKGHTGGFYANHELARIAGAKGGRASSRRKTTQVLKHAERKSNNFLKRIFTFDRTPV